MVQPPNLGQQDARDFSASPIGAKNMKRSFVLPLVGVGALALVASACGDDGAAGQQGEIGQAGANGANGANGESGEAGANGATGATGANGAAGANGANGENGSAGADGTNGSQRRLSFAPVEAPTTDADKRKVIASSTVSVNGNSVPVEFVTEARSGETFGAGVFGRILDQSGNPLKNADNSDVISPSNDFSSILKVGTKLFELTHFETTPAAIYLSELEQDDNGHFTITSTKNVDFSAFHGLWTPCAGSVSPWNTHLGSEEYPSDARLWETAATLNDVGAGSMIRYFGLNPATATVVQAKAVYNPYAYGYMTEIAVSEAGVPTVQKHYAAGRRALELAYVMPDKKTVYLTDDGTNDAFFMFVAKTAGDLSEGDLYAARWFQTSPAGQPHGAAAIYWIKLGPSATDAQVKALLDDGTVFSDIFETEAPAADGTCPNAANGFRSVVVDVSYTIATECLKLKAGQELAASRLESRRYAAYLGATTEFRKNEGITFNPEASRLYVSYSELNNGVMDNHPTRDHGGPNHMKLAANQCGAVFEFSVGPDANVGSAYVAHAANALVEGVWLEDPAAANAYPAGSPYAGKNACSVNGIANPDNISYIPGYDTLLIGEDSGAEHQNDAVWAYNVVTRELTRIVTTPYGAETTGVYVYPDLNGHAYIKVQVQHPYGESDQAESTGPEDLQSYTGYVGPLPLLN